MKRIRIGVMTLMTALTFFFVPSLAAEAAEGLPGTEVTVSFPFSDIQSVDARIKYSNREIFSAVEVSQTLDMNGTATEDAVCYNSDGSNKSGSIRLTLTIPEDAEIGSRCVISLDELNITDASGNYTTMATKTAIVNVVEVLGEEDGEEDDEEIPVRTDVDTSLLEEQIKIAERIQNAGYTKESWNYFLVALADAREALKKGTQEEIDQASADLVKAMKSFEMIDYSRLQAAINEANELVASDLSAQVWHKLLTALNNGSGLLSGDEQSAVDAAAEEILKCIEEVREALRNAANAGQTGSSVVIEPTEDYCNIAMHNVWPILFFISLAGNVVFIVVLFGRIRGKRSKTKDDTPLVDYEIGDDE